jgi:2-dehydro-3-deoxy-D-gluconate 5-dehydrogenase
MFDLHGKVALVTGGNGGIGLAMAQGLAAAGARIAVVGRNPDKLRAAVASLSQDGKQGQEDQAKAYAVDVCDEAAVASLMAQVIADFGRLDILVNNAGINIRKQVQDLALSEWNAVMDTNLTSAFLCSRAAFPHLKKQGGKVINIGSMTSIFGASFAPAYSASKGGIVQLTRALATAWANDNIQVNAVLPGWIDTELTQQARVEVNGLNERILARTPAGRWGRPQDLAGIAVFLSSAASDFITGTAIPVDGGYSVQA